MRRPPAEPMHQYVVWWRRLALTLMAAGWLLAPFVMDLFAVVGLCILGIFLALIAYVFCEAYSQLSNRNAPTISQVVAGAGVAVATVAAVQALGGEVLWLLLLMAATSPVVVSFLRDKHRLGAAAPDMADTADTIVTIDTAAAANLSTPALVQAWRASLPLLALAKTSRAKAAVAARRREYLDELVRRDPDFLRRPH